MGEALAGRRRWVWGAAAVVVLALVAFGVVRALTADAVAKPVAAATVAVDRGAVTSAVATTGTVQPAQTRSLSFAVAGTVESISVRAGTTVTAGQALAKVDDTDAAEAVDDARDALDDAEDALDEAEDAASAAPTCAANVPAAYPSPSATPTAGGTPSARPTTTTPTKTASPTGGGGSPGGGGASDGGSSPGGGGASGGGASGGGATGGGTSAGGGGSTGGAPTGGNPTGGAESGGACGTERGQQSGDAILSAQQRVTQATTALEKAEEALAGATIKAPIAGRILTVGGKVGSQVTAGNAFITLADVYDMQISAAFPEADADRLAVEQPAVVTLADRAGQEFQATVVQVDPVGTSDGTLVRFGVLLSFDSSPKDLLVGQSASVRVTTGATEEALRVPTTAVHDVAGDRGTVLRDGARTEVSVGLRGDQYTEITKGLAEGDEIVRSW
ncbi:efflux RND transporter periplasmic adaptor subunit [Paractinoplanes lichenicola]|uniref:Efflux RND transporter periplasmic adaptor subunit n=1 Tax=Paractinoplanes lichenicola TaxID=2802976 RepID=A0ABS1W4L3_9ACTN|nr:efflux RND transporter periplasmic adaptor subunit [Actinoplanes lichenicola]MBL7261677.1 efflux RND transporter periplasmic adaptor subunit [Actinoplanes lichenicola]